MFANVGILGTPSILIVGILIAALLWRLIRGSKWSRQIDLIPGPKGLPIVGNLFDVIMPPEELIRFTLRLKNDFGPIAKLWLGPLPIVLINSREFAEVILSSNDELEKSIVYKMIYPWLGDGLLTSSGQRWFKHRKMITPTFHFKILESFVSSFESNSLVLVERLAPYAESGEAFDIHYKITLAALDIICDTAMGVNLHSQESKEKSPYATALYRFLTLTTERYTRVYLHPDKIYALTAAGKESAACIKTMHDFTDRVIRERKQQRELEESHTDRADGIKRRKAFLDLLLDAGGGLSDKDLREEVDTFMFEGHDTTTSGITWAIYLLGMHPEIQDQAAEEVLSLWPRGTELTLQTLNEMKLLERIIKEALRLYPSVPFISRFLNNDLRFGDYVVPGKTMIGINLHGLHRNQKVFPDPEKFDPDRFLLENLQGRHPYDYLPFSAGPRNCIGQKFAILEEKSILAGLLRAYKITTVDKPEDVLPVWELILRSVNGINVTLEPRK